MGQDSGVKETDYVFEYGVKGEGDLPESHEVWYEDVMEYSGLTLEEAVKKPDSWYAELYGDPSFVSWVQSKLREQYPSAILVLCDK